MRHTDPLSRYLRAVERRLPLPKEYKTRVLRDLQSSIVARREAGQSDAEIIASLGSPAETAKELCEELPEHVYRKSPWRFVFLALALGSAFALFSGGFSQLLLALLNSSIGVIGSADGATAVFISTTQEDLQTSRILCAAVLAASLTLYALLRRCRVKKK